MSLHRCDAGKGKGKEYLICEMHKGLPTGTFLSMTVKHKNFLKMLADAKKYLERKDLRRKRMKYRNDAPEIKERDDTKKHASKLTLLLISPLTAMIRDLDLDSSFKQCYMVRLWYEIKEAFTGRK